MYSIHISKIQISLAPHMMLQGYIFQGLVLFCNLKYILCYYFLFIYLETRTIQNCRKYEESKGLA